MFCFVVYVVARRLLRSILGGSSLVALEVENAVLRHQLAVLRRTVKRPRGPWSLAPLQFSKNQLPLHNSTKSCQGSSLPADPAP